MKKPYIKDRRGEERHTALKRDPIGVGVGAGKADRARRRGGARQRAERRRAESAQRAAREAAEAALNGDDDRY